MALGAGQDHSSGHCGNCWPAPEGNLFASLGSLPHHTNEQELSPGKQLPRGSCPLGGGCWDLASGGPRGVLLSGMLGATLKIQQLLEVHVSQSSNLCRPVSPCGRSGSFLGQKSMKGAPQSKTTRVGRAESISEQAWLLA